MAEENELVQIIDFEGEFNPNFDDLIKKWNFADRGCDYKILAVLGAQSSGKSTILNMLFNTTFAVMDSTKGRSQTTQGIWISRADCPDVLVFDVEGTDAEERGEDSISFERKTSLFSLALAEILLINIWMHDIGRMYGSNLQLLKNVIELNLQLFSKQSQRRTLLLFVIRDWDGQSPVEKLAGRIRNTVDEAWASIQKPAEYKNAPITDLFDFDYLGVAHKVYQPDAFTRDVAGLRERLINSSRPDYLFDKSYHNDVPADGFAHYARSIWEVIKTNKDLDLPSQKEMLAMYRCDEISNEAYQEFTLAIEPLQAQLRRGQVIEDFGSLAESWVNKAMDFYREPASRYHPEVSQRKGQELLKKMQKDLHTMYLDQISKLRQAANEEFDRSLKKALPPGDDDFCENFSQVVTDLSTQALETFRAQARASVLPSADPAWQWDAEAQELQGSLQRRILVERDQQLRKLLEFVKKELKLTALEPLEDELDKAEPGSMWRQIRVLFARAQEAGVEKLAQRLRQSFDCSEDDVQRRKEQMEQHIREMFVATIKSRVDDLQNSMQKRFEKLFKYDDNGLPKKWKKGEDLVGKYTRDYQAVSSQVELFSVLRLKDEDDEWTLDDPKLPVDLILLSKRNGGQLLERFKTNTDALYQQAQHEQENDGVRYSIPSYMIGLVLVLAYDEIWWIMSNPILLTLAVMFGGAAALVWYLNLWFMIAPVLQTVQGLLMDRFKQIMEQYINPQAAAQRANANKPKQE